MQSTAFSVRSIAARTRAFRSASPCAAMTTTYPPIVATQPSTSGLPVWTNRSTLSVPPRTRFDESAAEHGKQDAARRARQRSRQPLLISHVETGEAAYDDGFPNKRRYARSELVDRLALVGGVVDVGLVQ